MKKNPQYLRRAKLVRCSIERGIRSMPGVSIGQDAAAARTFRQEPGSKNPLGTLRVDMPNCEAADMHDTPFEADVRGGLSLPLAWMRAS